MKEFPVPIERIQSDTTHPRWVVGSEFISHEFTRVLRKHRVKLRPNRARAPHLNGKMDRRQSRVRPEQTDLVEFYALEIDGKGRHRRAKQPGELAKRQGDWQRFYNDVRPHGGLGGKTPWQRWKEVAPLTPTRAEPDGRYDPASEPTVVKRGNRIWVHARK